MSTLFRYGTVLVVAIATTFVAIDQSGTGDVMGRGGYAHYSYTIGWPYVVGTHRISEPMVLSRRQGGERIDHWDFNWWLVSLDLLVYLVIVGGAFAIARHYLPLIRFGRISLSTMFVAVTTCALLTMLLTWKLDPMSRLFPSVGNYRPITLYSSWISAPVIYGLACVSFIIVRFAGISTRRLTTFLTQSR